MTKILLDLIQFCVTNFKFISCNVKDFFTLYNNYITYANSPVRAPQFTSYYNIIIVPN